MDDESRVHCRKQIESEEGRKATLYRDSKGYLSIGIGRLLDTRKGGHLREVEIDFLFDQDFLEAEAECAEHFEFWPKLSPVRQAALINMRFQLGMPKLLEFSRTLRAIRDEKWADARHFMLDSLWAKQTPNRARRVAYQIETGEWQ